MDDLGSFPAKISMGARSTLYRDFRTVLVQQKIDNEFKTSCFVQLGHIVVYYKFNGQLIRYMLLHRVKMLKIAHYMFCKL